MSEVKGEEREEVRPRRAQVAGQNHTLDFVFGFYTTANLDQARLFVAKKCPIDAISLSWLDL